jgi:hypothetical protein
MRETVSKLSTFVHGSRSLGCHMRRDSSRKRELLKETSHSFLILCDIWVNFSVGSFEVHLRDKGRATMSWTRYVNDAELSLFDESVQMDVNEVLSWSGAKVPKKTTLDVR